MTSFKLFNQRSVSVVALFGVLLSTVASAVVPTLAFAAQVTERSVEMSSSVKGATGVSYEINFKPAAAGAGFIVEFCTDSPLIGAACDDPGSTMNLGSVGFVAPVTAVTGVESGGSMRVAVTVPLTANTPVSATLTGITNPTAGGTNGVLYARITTYANMSSTGYTSATSLGSVVDQGSVALALTDNIGVTADVLETMTFCVSKVAIGDSCAGVEAPTIAIGELTGTVRALSSAVVSTGDIFTQLSTNASKGAIVSLKSDVSGCGGMRLVGGANGNCYIAPALQTNITFGQAKFGLIANAETDGTNPNGTFQIVPASGYDDEDYALNYAGDELTGVTSTYGDPLLNTAGGPVNNKNMKLTFGASITNQTPAGRYAANLSLIATGTF